MKNSGYLMSGLSLLIFSFLLLYVHLDNDCGFSPSLFGFMLLYGKGILFLSRMKNIDKD